MAFLSEVDSNNSIFDSPVLKKEVGIDFEVVIPENVLTFIIEYYTDEEGVRKLREKFCRETLSQGKSSRAKTEMFSTSFGKVN